MNIRERLGRFVMSFEFLDNENLPFKDKVNIFNGILVLDAKCNFATQTVEYMGTSEDFRLITEGEEVPIYQILVTRSEDDIISYSFKEMTSPAKA